MAGSPYKTPNDYTLLLSFVGQARLKFARFHSRLVFLVCRGICMTGIFAVADALVSAWLGYLLLRMLFRMRWYLHGWDICCCGCFLGCVGIRMAKIFDIADAFFLPSMYNCIFNLLISWLADTHFYKIASATCLFYNLKMLPTQKLHPQFTYSKTCRCFCSKNNILNLLILRLVDASPQFLLNCVLWNINFLTLYTLNFVIWYHYIFRGFLFSEFSKP